MPMAPMASLLFCLEFPAHFHGIKANHPLIDPNARDTTLLGPPEDCAACNPIPALVGYLAG